MQSYHFLVALGYQPALHWKAQKTPVSSIEQHPLLLRQPFAQNALLLPAQVVGVMVLAQALQDKV